MQGVSAAEFHRAIAAGRYSQGYFVCMRLHWAILKRMDGTSELVSLLLTGVHGVFLSEIPRKVIGRIQIVLRSRNLMSHWCSYNPLRALMPRQTKLLIKLLRLDSLLGNLLIMPINQRSLKQSLQLQDLLVTPHPRIVIARQPTLRMTRIMILPDMILVHREDERAIFGEADLHDAETWRVARGVVERDALAEVVMGVGEGLPV